MTDWSYDPYDPIDADRPSLSRRIFVRTMPAFAAFSFSALVALRLAGGLAEQAVAPDQAPQPATTLALQAEALPVTAALKTSAAREGVNPFGALFDQDGSLVGAPANTAMSEPVGPAFSPFQSQPLFVMVDPVDAPPQDAPSQDASQQDASPQDAEAEAPPQATEQVGAAPTPPPAPQQQVAEAEPGVPVPPSRPSELSVQPRVAELSAPPRGLDNATPRKERPAPPSPSAKGRRRPRFRKTIRATSSRNSSARVRIATPKRGRNWPMPRRMAACSIRFAARPPALHR